ncbi:hypothetical protein JTB14_002643 [Gonioctena quinquepunctata]|nr:hypothetical protein JTB14_002643 [Gonioctena quinquepunctata]
MEEINRSMVDSIRILEQENTRYSRELTELKGQTDVIHPQTKLVADTKTYHERNHEHICVDNKEEKAVEGNKNKILILCDEGDDARGKLEARQKSQKKYFDISTKPLPGLEPNCKEFVKNKTREWKPGKVLNKSGPNDYNIEMDVAVYRRNRQFLREARSRLPVSSSSSDSSTEDSPELEDEPPANLTSGKHEREDTIQSASEAENDYYKTRSGRIVKPIERLQFH